MERRMVRIWLVVIIGMVLSTVSGPVYGAQLAYNSNDPALNGYPHASHWTFEIIGDSFGLDQPGDIIAWETKKVGMAIAPGLENSFQWADISNNIITCPSYSTGRKVFPPYGSAWINNWTTEEIFSGLDLFSPKEIQTEEKDDTSGPPPLHSALWICGFGIIGILSVRRTNDHSNVS
jgi:hypothetical protein